VLTFDDGFANVLEYGLEPLARCRFRAIQFLVADRLGQVNDWDAPKREVMVPLMDGAQVRDWLAAGHAIGAHTLTHPRLAQIPLAAAREEIFSSKKKLEDLFGVPIEHFCFPYGDCNDAVRDLVAEAGYRTACTTAPGVNTPADPPLALKRLMARHQSLSIKSLWKRLTGEQAKDELARRVHGCNQQ
jgi:peptidoglycan/xylan/chitin deacetylase (PgdA/CDA1 family)